MSSPTKQNIKKIYLVWNYLQWGGAQIFFLSIVRQAGQDFKFILVVPKETNEDILKFFEPFNVEFRFLDTVLDISSATGIKAKLRRRYRKISSELTTYRFFKNEDLENSIIHIESVPWQSFGLLTALARLTNVITTIHNAIPKDTGWREFLWSKRLNSLLRRKTFQIFAANQNAVENFRKRISSKFWDKLKLTRACIDSSQIKKVADDAGFDREKLLKKHNLPTDKFIVLSVGQFVDRKGRWIFLDSAQDFKRTNSDVIFVWLMPNLPAPEEKSKIESYDLDNYFYPVRSADVGAEREDILSFFKIADIFALPSYIEGLPITVLEAMGLGVCTISTNINAIPEAVKNMETGILIESGNKKELTEAILKLKVDDELRKELATRGQRFVLENFDEAHWANVALEEYRKCFKG